MKSYKTLPISRRSFLGLALSSSLFLAGDLYLPKIPSLIRPPGAVREEKFLELCIRCLSCVKVCPTKALQPAIWEAGIVGIYTPHLVFKIAGCKMCMECGKVCPTGALKKIKPEDMKIGSVKIDKKTCIAWREEKLCLICVEQCPTSAIVADDKKRPIIHQNKCSGCGICENVCPVKPPSIKVTNEGERRY